MGKSQMLSHKSRNNNMENLKKRLKAAVDSIMEEKMEIARILFRMQIVLCDEKHNTDSGNAFNLRDLNKNLINGKGIRTQRKSDRPAENIRPICKGRT